ncbi:hypothetical protein AAE478_005728 [Parahypoxylon ruwenzoriense]
MSILCCCGNRRTRRTAREPTNHDTLELPVHPPRAKLSNSPLPASEPELASPPATATQAPSLRHNPIPEATVDPTVLEIEDSDDDDEFMRSTRNSSTGTLEAIKTRLVRRISQKSGLRRHSQQSLGTSDEEVARRAELKRLMRKRIQEELQSEEEVETKSNLDESKPDGCAHIDLPGGGPRDNIEFSVSDVNETGSKDLALIPPDSRAQTLSSSEFRPRISIRRNSDPGSGCRSDENTVFESHGTIKERGSLPQLPSSPQLAPAHRASIRASRSSCSSWRLSYSVEHLADYFGIPDNPNSDRASEHAERSLRNEDTDEENEPEDCINNGPSMDQGPVTNVELSAGIHQKQLELSHGQQNDPNDAESCDDSCPGTFHDNSSEQDSPLDIWLRSQELQSTSAISSRRTSDMILQMIPENFSPDGRLSRSQDIDNIRIYTDNVHAPSEAFSTTRRVLLESWALDHDSHDTGTDPREFPGTGSDGLWRPVTRPSGASEDVSPTVDRVQGASSSLYTSSRYTSRPNSCQATTKQSRRSLIELLGGRKAISPLSNLDRLISPSRTTDTGRSDASSYKTAPNEMSAPGITMHEVWHARRPTMETCSVAVSDTASFRQREAELRSIEKRFGQAELRRGAATPMVSKFREEFNEPRSSLTTRQSLLARLHLTIPKRGRYLEKDIQRDDIHITEHSSSGNRDDKDGRLGQQKLKQDDIYSQPETPSNMGLNAEGYDAAHLEGPSPRGQIEPANIHAGKEVPRFPFNQELTDIERNSLKGKVSYVSGLSVLQPRGEGSTLKPPSSPRDKSSQKSDLSNNVLREWVNLMNGDDSQLKTESNVASRNRSPPRFRTPPASWAKWPSHTRLERTGPAGKEDNVISRDFAIRVESHGSDTTWSTDKPSGSSKRHIPPPPEGLSAQVGRLVKGSLSRIVSGKHDTSNHDTRASSETYLSLEKSNGLLEYPELEILPMQGGYKELQALEQQIGTMKRGPMASEGQSAGLSPDNTKPQLSMRLAEKIHMIQHGGSGVLSEDDEHSIAPPPVVSPVTPKSLLLAPRGVSGATSRFETPGSHVSYDDCLPKHMLEDERPVENDMGPAKNGK